MTTVTEKYINKAVQEAKKEFSGTKIQDVSIVMNMEADGATQILAEALRLKLKPMKLTAKLY